MWIPGNSGYSIRNFPALRTCAADRRRPTAGTTAVLDLPAAGCIMPLTLDERTVAALRAGSVLKIKVKSADQKDVALSVSLKGLAPAMDRLGVLAGS
ncbi:hypothetical protein EN925_07230 [Mesorhizobium sp. M7A.F.Ca.US.006.04.2.1]|nr:hypothetical protein EN990_07765 [Mesorhizobium sp. M7A.F.Ca.US.005.03.1.1]RUY08594.1 hypothetical protein EN991_30990 [Mesorhizobium sp. M7A.F.Ca.US.005.03.2.1]RVA93973.1 hypothetical protein EN925_07230 [Mesorhizobium sp. M7A.F.Ca.US.006.04.2.1]